MKTGPQIEFAHKSGAAAFLKRMAGLTRVAAYVGVPAAKSSRKGDVNNAELLFIFENGSPIHKQPPRPLLKPAINADGNKQKIAKEISGSVKLSLAGDAEGAKKKMLRAALAGQTAVRGWFTDPRNGWQQNAPSTIAHKLGKLKPKKRAAAYAQIDSQEGDTTGVVTVGVDTGQMRAAIVGVVHEE